MKRLVVFDFDGTLTTHDTLIELLRFARGPVRLALALLVLSPLLVLMKLHLANNGRVKERLFSLYFKGMRFEDFDQLCQRFATERGQALRRPATWKVLDRALKAGDEVAVVSASINNWVAPFFHGLNAMIIGTQIEVADGRLTGRFATPNCYGEEKVRRLIKELPALKERNHYYIIAFGDSRGDREMLAYADEGHYLGKHNPSKKEER